MLVRGIPDDPMSLKVAKKDQQGFLNPFYPNVPFLYLLKTSKNLKISDVCRAIVMEHWAKMGQFRNTFEIISLARATVNSQSHLLLSRTSFGWLDCKLWTDFISVEVFFSCYYVVKQQWDKLQVCLSVYDLFLPSGI